jgi:diguanylate cyclase (GGDEF)-like protein/PAS domain S-box-containing protein
MINDVATATGIAAAAVAAACGLLAYMSRREMRGWFLVGAGALAWAVGIGMWLAGGKDPHHLGSLLVLASPLLAGAGAVMLPGGPPHLSGRSRNLVDALIVAGSALFIAGVFGFGDLYADAHTPNRALLLGATLAMVALAAGAGVALTRARPAGRRHLGLLTAAFGLLAVASCALTYVALGGPAAFAQKLAWLSIPGWAVLACAALDWRRTPSEDEIEPGLPTRASVFIPSVPFALAVMGAAYAGARGEFEPFLIWTGSAVIVLIVMRQILALVENIAFWRTLESKVEARTDELRSSESRFRALVQNSSDAIFVFTPDGEIRYVSPSVKAIFGTGDKQWRRDVRWEMVAEEDRGRVRALSAELTRTPRGTVNFECRMRRADGELREIEAVARNLTHDPDVNGFVVNARDITERKDLERQLTHRAFHDPLTELANRALFNDRLEHAVSRREREADTLAVLFLDLDDFKDVNDSLGHDAGDALLREVAGRLLSSSRPPDTVARLGGDEFAILLEDIDGALGAARVAERLLKAFEPKLALNGTELELKASVGIATNSRVSETAEKLLRNADVAMYSAKAAGKGRFEHFEQGMHDALVERLDMERDLRAAIDRDQLVLHYQPVVSLKNGNVPAVEALVRWNHPTRGLLAPGHFIPLAESTGLVVPLGRWVVQEACNQAAEWHDREVGDQPVRMMVNIAPRQLESPGLVEDVAAALETSGLDPRDLLLEITESAVVEDEQALFALEQLLEMGVGIGVDDFGAKYSSLTYLRRLPMELLKIDREFMENVAEGSIESGLMESILGMARGMGLTPVVEGVETAEQEAELRRMGCDLAQGFLFARPEPPAKAARLIEAGVRAPS